MPWADCRHGQSAAAPHPTDELGPWVAGQPLIPVSLGGRSGSTPATPARRACHCPVKGRLSQRGRPLCRAVDRNNEQRCRPLRWQSRDTCPPPPPPPALTLVRPYAMRDTGRRRGPLARCASPSSSPLVSRRCPPPPPPRHGIGRGATATYGSRADGAVSNPPPRPPVIPRLPDPCQAPGAA